MAKKSKPYEGMSQDQIVNEIRMAHRRWNQLVGTRMMLASRLQHGVAATIVQALPKAERPTKKVAMDQAAVAIEKFRETGEDPHNMAMVITSHVAGIDAMRKDEAGLYKSLELLAAALPIAPWIGHQEQRGLGFKSVSAIIGETGDLNNYPGPASVWSMMAVAPYTARGQTLMGGTWRRMGSKSLSAEQWSNYGYSPRRRALMWAIGECLVKQNGGVKPKQTAAVVGDDRYDDNDVVVDPLAAIVPGPYRARYDWAKADAAIRHPEWLQCRTCEGSGQTESGSKCSTCKGSARMTGHIDNHAKLLMVKLVLKNLWRAWHGLPNVTT